MGLGLTFDTYLTPLFFLQKKIIRCLKFQPATKPSASLFYSLKILKLEDLIHVNTLSFVHKAINELELEPELGPASFHNYFILDIYVHKYGTGEATKGDLFISLKRNSLSSLKAVQHVGSNLRTKLPLLKCTFHL